MGRKQTGTAGVCFLMPASHTHIYIYIHTLRKPQSEYVMNYNLFTDEIAPKL